MANVLLDGLPSSFIVPGTYAQYFGAQGPSTTPAGARKAAYVMPKMSAGTATVNTVYQVRTEAEAKDLSGAGSPFHRAFRMHQATNKAGKLYFLARAETAGTAADGYFNWSGTATASGVAFVDVCGERTELAIYAADGYADVASGFAALINAKDFLPVVASSTVGGKLLLTSKLKGAAFGSGAIRIRAGVKSGIGITVAASGAGLGLGSGTAGVDGGTTDATNLETALSGIESTRYYYLGINDNSSTALTNLSNHLVEKQTAVVGLPSVGIAAFTGTKGAASTLATTQNNLRLQLVVQPNSEHDPASLVGWTIGTRQRGEALESRFNFEGARDSNLKAVFDPADIPDSEDLNDMLTDGCTPIASDENGGYLVLSITTQCRNSSGGVDLRATDTHRVSVGDEFMDEARNKCNSTYQGFFIKDDAKDKNGNINLLQVIPSKTMTPSTFRPFWVHLLNDYEQAGKLKNVQATKDSLYVQLDPQNKSRMEVEINLDVIDIKKQIAARVNEVSAG